MHVTNEGQHEATGPEVLAAGSGIVQRVGPSMARVSFRVLLMALLLSAGALPNPWGQARKNVVDPMHVPADQQVRLVEGENPE